MEKCKLNESITSKRLVLKKREHAHDDDMWEAISQNRKFLREYLFWVDGTQSFADVVKATDYFAELWENDGEWAYDIYSIEDNRLLGSVGAHNINFQNQKAEIGYWLRRSETGKGYMKEAVLALEAELFNAGFHRLEIHCDVNNLPSQGVAKRCGYELESVAKESLYHYTGLHDRHVYVKFSPYPITGF